jgi:hypothetical protein
LPPAGGCLVNYFTMSGLKKLAIRESGNPSPSDTKFYGRSEGAVNTTGWPGIRRLNRNCPMTSEIGTRPEDL